MTFSAGYSFELSFSSSKKESRRVVEGIPARPGLATRALSGKSILSGQIQIAITVASGNFLNDLRIAIRKRIASKISPLKK
jgi:hypothetical protein